MNRETLIQPSHLSRTALVYVRQSTPKQVALNQESTRRQYQLTEMAQKLGWPRPRISVIDDDLGLSGTSSNERLGFQRLVAAISLGEVGLVLVTEVSRLSRLNSDWHRVIELCAVFETLIADEDGLDDPRDPNDRLVLGLKGTLFSAELHILHARMRGGLLNKARRGALALRLPVGCGGSPMGAWSRIPMSRCGSLFRRSSTNSGGCRVPERFNATSTRMVCRCPARCRPAPTPEGSSGSPQPTR